MRPITDRIDRMSRSASAVLQIADQDLDEPRAVAPLERQFLVVDNDGGHRIG